MVFSWRKPGRDAPVAGAAILSLQSPWIEEEVDHVDFLDAVEVGGRIAVQGEKNFGVIVANGLERCEFTDESRLFAGGERDLIVVGNGVFERDEVDFVDTEGADEDLTIAALQLKVDDVLENTSQIAWFVRQKQTA